MLYRVQRIKGSAREAFRWAAHTGGLAVVKSKDYEAGEEIESSSPYAAWNEMRRKGKDLHPGDLLEECDEANQPRSLVVFKYIGFEPAQWWVPEQQLDTNSENQKNQPGL